jgi:hypothetical protein
MPANKQLQNIRNDIYDAELADVRQWTRAKVNECIVSTVIMAQRFSPYDPAVAEMLSTWPADCTVRYEWFRNLALRPELQINPQQNPTVNSIANVYRVLARWLHRIDSNMERAVLILHACGVSFDKIAEMFPDRRWTRQTLSRRHTKCLESLVYDLNHIDELKWPAGKSFWDFK